MKTFKDILFATVLTGGFILDVYGSHYVYAQYGLLYSMAFGFVVSASVLLIAAAIVRSMDRTET